MSFIGETGYKPLRLTLTSNLLTVVLETLYNFCVSKSTCIGVRVTITGPPSVTELHGLDKVIHVSVRSAPHSF